MNGPIQWTPGGLVSALTSSSAGVKAPVVQLHNDEPHEELDDGDSDAEAVAPVAMLPNRPASRPKPSASLLPPMNVVKLARARLAQINAELRQMKKLEAEREELRRLLDAAKPRRRAVVRELKRPAG